MRDCGAALPGGPSPAAAFQSQRYRSRFRRSSATLLRWTCNLKLRVTEFSYTIIDFQPSSGSGTASACGETRTGKRGVTVLTNINLATLFWEIGNDWHAVYPDVNCPWRFSDRCIPIG